jgi:hypothetical protein
MTDARRGSWVRDVALLSALTGLVGLAFLYAQAPLYNAPGTIDPWLYTALFTNFDFTYQHYWSTYYASRLPWVVPGLFTHELFGDRVAFVVLHAVFFLSGAVALFVVVRRFLGRVPAFAAYAVLITNQLYFNAQNWDYVDGAIVTYLLLAYACGLTRARGALRALAMVGAGFFLMAAVGTNLFAVTLAAGFPLLYVGTAPLRGNVRRIAADAAAVVVGAAGLVVAGGLFAVAAGADFWFLEPQIRALREINTSSSRVPGYDWILRMPRMLSPLVVLLAGAVLLRRLPAGNAIERERRRFAFAAYIHLGVLAGFLFVWNELRDPVLQLPYYASLLLPALALGVAAVVYAGSAGVRAGGVGWALVGTVTAAAALPIVLIYRPDDPALVGRTGTWITIVICAAILVIGVTAAVARRWRIAGTVAAFAVVVTMAFGVNLSTAASDDVFQWAVSNPANGPTYDVGMDLVDFMRRSDLQRDMPYFWYHAADGPELTSIQSLYYFGYTYLGLDMPMIDNEFKERVRTYDVKTIVLLCVQRGCRGGPEALRAQGYALREVAQTRLASGDVDVWARAFRVEGT